METVSFVFMAAGLGTVPVVLWWMGRMNNRPWDEWQTILDAEGHRAYRTLQQRIQWDRELIDDTYGRAMSARYRGAVDEAARMLDVGFSFLTDVAGERRELLAQLSQYSRMITSFLPAAAVPPARFRVGSVRTVAGLALLGHHLLVTGRERMQLRLYVLRLGFKAVLTVIVRSRTSALRPNPDHAWTRINAGREDFHALSQESLESLRVLLLSLAAHRERGGALQRV